MHNYHVDSLSGNCWCDVTDYSSLLDAATGSESDFNGSSQQALENICMLTDISLGEITTPDINSEERECPRKRGRSDLYGGAGTKACRDRARRGKLNDRFVELSAILEPGRPAKTEKLAILSDAIRLLNRLKAESQEYTEMNKRLMEEIKTLKAEKNEIREEKLKLKTEKYRIEQQLKTMNIPPIGFSKAPPIYQADVNKVQMLPSYGFVPMWQYLSPSVRDTSQDDILRPPAA